ncbi:MAG: hypothetical protein K8S24_06260 [Candidatus Aegiribacteria sp.]|nr:hypothetical protein [Candidatus Aegiribacteria sp.]
MFPSDHTRRVHDTPVFILTLIILLSIPSIIISGPPEIIWETNLTTGFDCRFWGVDCTDDGGAVCAGESAFGDGETTSLLLTKYTPLGLVQWQTVTGWGLATTGQDVLQVPGGYIVCGSIFSGTDYDGFIAKFDYFGDIVWCNHLENLRDDVLYDVTLSGDSCYAAAGYTESTGSGRKDAWLVLVDFYGNLQWSRSFGTSESEIAYSVAALRDGGFALAGGSEGNFYIVITDEEGIERDTRAFDHGGHETARVLIESKEGGFFIAGSTMESGSYQANIWLARVDFSWNEIWSYEIEREDNDSAWDVVEPVTGGYIILGNTMSSGSGKYDAVLYRIDPWGKIIWEICAGDSLWNTSSGLSMNSEGNLFFAGRTELSEGGLFASWIVYTTPEDLLDW